MKLMVKKILKASHQTAFLFIIMILSGCSSRMADGQITATAVPTEHSSPTIPTSSATVEVAAEEKTVLPPENILQFQPFEVTSDVPLIAKPIDALVICGDLAVQLLRFTPKVNIETIPGITGEPFCLPTSPDGEWIA